MLAGAFLVAALWVSAEGPAPSRLIFVPEAEGPETCFAVERLAAVLRASPGYRVVRAPLQTDESLENARQRLGATWALSGQRLGEAGAEHYELRMVGPLGETKASAKGSGRIAIHTALLGLWPKDLPLPERTRIAGVPGPAALDAACLGRSDEALQLAGAAVGRSIAHLVPIPEAAAKGPLLARWGRATTLARQGRTAQSIPLLRSVLADLEAGQLGPIWRRPSDGLLPSAVQLSGELGLTVGAGRILAVDLGSGETRWSLELGASEPVLADLGQGQVAVFLAGEVVGLITATGQIAFRVPFKRAQPEVALGPGRFYVSEAETTAAVDRNSGQVLWTYDGLVTPAAGPVLAAAQVVTPLEASLVFLDPDSGAEKAKLKLGDELSAPLSATPGGLIWALVGSDEVVAVDAARHAIVARLKDLPGIEWPPAVLGEQLVISHRRGPIRFVSFLDASAKNPLRLSLRNAAPPVLALPDYSGVLHLEERPPAVVARSTDGRVLWRYPQREKITHLSLVGDQIVVAAGKRIAILDRQRGKPLSIFELDEKVLEVALGPEMGVALTSAGTLYGLPTGRDPRVVDWPRAVRLELAEAYLEARQPAQAVALARAVLALEPSSLEALALLATAKARVRPSEGAGELLRVLAAIGPNEPLARSARTELETRVGLIDLAAGAPGQERLAALVGEQVLTSTRALIMPQAIVRRGTRLNDRLLFELDHHPAGPQALTWLYALYAGTLTKAFEHNVPGRYRVVAGTEGWALVADKQLRWLTKDGGLRPSAVLGASIAEVALPGGSTIYARTTDHLLVAIDGATGLPKGRVQLGPLTRLVGKDGQVAVEEVGGRVLVFDAQRLLLLAK